MPAPSAQHRQHSQSLPSRVTLQYKEPFPCSPSPPWADRNAQHSLRHRARQGLTQSCPPCWDPAPLPLPGHGSSGASAPLRRCTDTFWGCRGSGGDTAVLPPRRGGPGQGVPGWGGRSPGAVPGGDSSGRGARAALPGGPVPRLCSAGCKKLIYFWKSSSQSLSNSTRTSSVHSILNQFLLCFKFIKHNQCSLVKAAPTRGAGEEWQSSISSSRTL